MRLLLILFFLAQQTPTVSPENGTVTGVLRTADGKPAVGVRVTAMAPPGIAEDASHGAAMVSLGETDKNGRYRLENVPPGRYYITAGRLDALTYFPGTLEPSSGRIVALTPSSELIDVNFTLKDESQGRAVSSDLMFFIGSLNPGLSVPVSISVEGSGKVPVFSNGDYPVIRLTETSTGKFYDTTFSNGTFSLPLPVGAAINEYSVSFDDIPQGFSVRSVRFGSTDVQKEPLKLSRSGLTIGTSVRGGDSAISPTMLSVLLAGASSASEKNGVRVSGSSIGSGGEIYIGDAPPNASSVLYADGTFEFRGVPPGFHTIVKSTGNSVTVAPVFVGSRDVEGVRLRTSPVLPGDLFSEEPRVTGNTPEPGLLPMVAVSGRVVDGVSKEPLTEGTVTLSGYGEVRRRYAIDGDGRFQISSLLPGHYSIAINVSGYSNEIRDVIVGLEDLKLDLTAQREAH